MLDVGCAKGFLVNEFLKNNIEAKGIDISVYAMEAPTIKKNIVLDSCTRILLVIIVLNLFAILI